VAATDPRRGAPAAGSTPPPASLAALAIIRVALLLGVLLFGAGTLFIQRRGGWSPAPAESLETLGLVGTGLWVVAIIGVIVLRVRGLGGRARAGAGDASIIGWAVGEGVALFGGVYYLLSGRPAWYINGLLFLVATFVIFPIGRVRR